MLTFGQLRVANLERCPEFGHGVMAWSTVDWLCALLGEVGETANLIKKYRRGETLSTTDLGDELADIVTYADLFAARCDIDLEEVLQDSGDVVTFHECQSIVGARCTNPIHEPTDYCVRLGAVIGHLCTVVQEGSTAMMRQEIKLSLISLLVCCFRLAHRFQIDLGEALRRKFNHVSERVGSEVTL